MQRRVFDGVNVEHEMLCVWYAREDRRDHLKGDMEAGGSWCVALEGTVRVDYGLREICTKWKVQLKRQSCLLP